jgi:two-component system phosphate regulon sensor histidine kinase PhoR
LVNEVVDNLKEKAAKKDIKIALKPKTKREIMVKADKHKIDQVLTNLIVNSINYGVKDGKTEIGFETLGDNIVIEVKDTGVGIEEEQIPRLFERFYRVDKSRSRNAGGTGLGLAIVKHIIDAHHQTINVTSKPGKGSTFSFTLKKA